MNLEPVLGDDPAFVRLVSLIADSLLRRHKPDLVALIEVDNWFDHKWLDFSGKVLGALGVWQKDLTIPPFHPSRIKAQTAYRLNGKLFTFCMRSMLPNHQPSRWFVPRA